MSRDLNRIRIRKLQQNGQQSEIYNTQFALVSSTCAVKTSRYRPCHFTQWFVPVFRQWRPVPPHIRCSMRWPSASRASIGVFTTFLRSRLCCSIISLAVLRSSGNSGLVSISLSLSSFDSRSNAFHVNSSIIYVNQHNQSTPMRRVQSSCLQVWPYNRLVTEVLTLWCPLLRYG